MNKLKLSGKVSCKQCGLCCIVRNKDYSYSYCKWLIFYVGGEGIHEPKTRCAIYKHRVYSVIGDKQYCHTREACGYSFPGCPYNKTSETMHPKYNKEISVIGIHGET